MGFNKDIGKLIIRLQADAKHLKRGLEDAEKQVEKSAARMKKSMGQLGKQMFTRFTLPIAGAAGAGVKAWADFDKAMVESTSIMTSVGPELRSEMAKTAKQLAGSSKQSATELAQAYFFLASAGKDAVQSQALLPIVAKFATAGAFDMSKATDLLTDAQSALGLSSKDAVQDARNLTRISDVLVKANTLANASVQQFSESLTADAATAGREFGQELEDIVSVLAVYADKGKKASEAGNMYGRAVRLLTKASRDSAEVFESANIRLVDKATGEYRKFVDVLADIEKATSKMTKPERGAFLEKLGFRALAQKAILPLIGTSEQIRIYQRALDDAAGTTEGVAAKQMEAFSNQLKVLKNNLVLVVMEIGEALAPVMRALVKNVQHLINWWKELNPTVKKWVGIVLAVVAAVGPLLIAMAAFSKIFAVLKVAAFTRALAVAVWKIGILKGSLLAAAISGGVFVARMIGARDAINSLNAAAATHNRIMASVKEKYDTQTQEMVDQIKTAEELNGILDALPVTGETRTQLLHKAMNAQSLRLQEQIKRAQDEIDGHKAVLERAKKALADRQGGIEGAVRGGIGLFADTLAAERAGIKDAEQRLASARQRVERLIAAQRKLNVEVKKVQDRTNIKVEIDKQLKDLDFRARTVGMDELQIALLKLKDLGANAKELGPVEAAINRLRGVQNDFAKLMQQRAELAQKAEEGKALNEQFADPQEKLEKRLSDLKDLLDVNAISFRTYSRAVREAEKQILNADKAADQARQSFTRFNAVAVGSAEAISRIADFKDFVKGQAGNNTAFAGRLAQKAIDQARREREFVGPPAAPKPIEVKPKEKGGGPLKPVLLKILDVLEKQAEKAGIKIRPADLAKP